MTAKDVQVGQTISAGFFSAAGIWETKLIILALLA